MIPAYIRVKAQAVADKLETGEVRPRILRRCRSRWLVVDLSKRWRFVSLDGQVWQVVSHEKYNKLTGMHANTTGA